MNWSELDDAELNRHYQDALEEREKSDDDRNWSEADIQDMEEEINERD